jgi:hypothetical protein
MSNTRVLAISSVVFLATLFAPRAIATTYVVDASGGGQFTDIPAAIAAAQPGDVLLVQSGTYSAFTLDKGLTIIGYGQPHVAGTATIQLVPAGQTAVLSSCAPTDVAVLGCAGPIILQDLDTIHHVDVETSADVRFRNVDVNPVGLPEIDACDVASSRVEYVRGSAHGEGGLACTGHDGKNGWTVTQSSRVQLALANANGGDGSSCSFPAPSGDGGSALSVVDSTMIVAGGGVSVILGGDQGQGYFDCLTNGNSGYAAAVSFSSSFSYSGAQLVCYDEYFGHACIDGGCAPVQGTATLVTPDDPTLDVSGSMTSGGSATFTLRAPPGSSAILYFGRHAVLIPDPSGGIEQLTQKSRIVHLGTIPASGRATFTWPIALGLPAGTILIAQAEVTVAPGDVRHTNSIPVVVR